MSGRHIFELTNVTLTYH